MSTGPEHYAEAERLLAVAHDSNPETPYFMAYTAQAQVHATLALTAATAGQETLGSDWREALGYPPIPYNSPDSLGPL